MFHYRECLKLYISILKIIIITIIIWNCGRIMYTRGLSRKYMSTQHDEFDNNSIIFILM